MKPFPKINNILELTDYFKGEEDCIDYLKSLIWNNDTPPCCPRCGFVNVYSFKNGKTYKCAECRNKFNLFTNTIFENTKLPLKKWITAIYILCSEKRGVSSYQLTKYIGVTQNTAWFMLQRIRKLFEALQPTALEGTCTADETYIGGKQKNKHEDKKVKGQQGRGSSEKINVVGVMQVGGQVKTCVTKSVGQDVLIPFLKQYVVPNSTIMTDEWKGYNGLNKTFTHTICDHNKKQYVSDTGATTNNLENYWSHVKRAVIGTYYHISKKHINRYLLEFDYKFNYRKLTDGDKLNLTLRQLPKTRLKYNDLIR